MSTALKVEGLGKKYLIKHQQGEKYTVLRDVMVNKSKEIITSLNPFSPSGPSQDKSIEEFWALRDIDFEINAGDKVGIIGRNGAGKSTLLKLLSRITEPTTGKISYNGKIASLLEVGTGFHPELTGRENIYLNGAILGMSRADIKRQFDEIVAFAEVEKFLDTPVKRYSSGMYVRLAFAVAAHIDTEILIVDEVLAVGDAKFQKKSLEKMNDISKSGRTLLFVSHNMGAISELCNKCIVLDKGRIDYQGDTTHAIQHYLAFQKETKIDIKSIDTMDASISYLKLTNKDEESKEIFDINEEIVITIGYEIKKNFPDFMIVITLYRNGNPIFHTFSSDFDETLKEHDVGTYEAKCMIPKMFLKAGVYSLTIATTTHYIDYQKLEQAITFEIDELSLDTTWKGYRMNRSGDVIFTGNWSVDRVN